MSRTSSAAADPPWPEHESLVHRPGGWLAVGMGLAATVCAAGMLMGGESLLPAGVNRPLALWVLRAATGLVAFMGVAALAGGLAPFIRPVRVRHAADDVVADVPRDPVVREGSVAHGRLTHELVEDAAGWEFRPRRSLWRSDLVFFWGFGVPFLTCFAAALSWIVRRELHWGWPGSIALAVTATLACGGTATFLIDLVFRASYRRLCRLRIPARGPLELDMPEEIDPDREDLPSGIRRIFVGDVPRQLLTLPRESVKAVQLCPWLFTVGAGTPDREDTRAVQVLLVLYAAGTTGFSRLPILLTGDFVGAARLAGQLAGVLRVPYVFDGHAEGWKAEAASARGRPALRSGGMQT